MSNIQLHEGDCLEIMQSIPDGSIDMILCDLPYGTTPNSWDNVISMDKLWQAYNRIIKPNGAIVLTGMGMFSANLMFSSEGLYRYSLIWEKNKGVGFLNANKMPLRAHEDILIFYKKLPTYNPQKTLGKPYIKKTNDECSNYQKLEKILVNNESGNRHPTSILKFNIEQHKNSKHPTQKPIALLSWLINSYTNKGDTILDNCMGSGSTGVACKILERNFIGIEKDPIYFKAAQERIENQGMNSAKSIKSPTQTNMFLNNN